MKTIPQQLKEQLARKYGRSRLVSGSVADEERGKQVAAALISGELEPPDLDDMTDEYVLEQLERDRARPSPAFADEYDRIVARRKYDRQRAAAKRKEVREVNAAARREKHGDSIPCAVCGKLMPVTRHNRKTCSNACRQKGYRLQKKWAAGG